MSKKLIQEEILSKEKVVEIHKSEYMNGESCIKIDEKYGLSKGYINKKFKKYGLPVRSNKINSKKYHVDSNYFENIDNHEKAYRLGFMSADGYITQPKHKRVGLALGIKDFEHIEKFQKCINSSYPISIYTNKNPIGGSGEYCRVIITDDKMYECLQDNGVVLNKTKNFKPPSLKYEYIKSFILGYFDGDGSIYVNSTKYPYYSISIVGLPETLDFISEYLVENKLIDKKPKHNKRKEEHYVCYIRWGGNNIVTKIMEHLYQDIDLKIPLKRKYELFLKCKNKVFV